MDLSPVTDALAVKSFDKIADICDTLMLQVPMFSLVITVSLVFARVSMIILPSMIGCCRRNLIP